MQHDQLAYASGADAVRWNVSVEYEGIEYVGFASTNQFASTVGTDAGSTVQTSDATQPVTAIDGGTMQVVTDSSGNPVVDSSGNPVRQGTP